MKFFKTKFFILLFSIFISVIFLIIFKPILISENVIFPYSIHPFNISKNYPTVWFYIKIVYCLNLFIVNFIISNSIFSFFKINKNLKHADVINSNTLEQNDNLKLLVGINSKTKKEVFISEKGLYQNILVTGTIGSR